MKRFFDNHKALMANTLAEVLVLMIIAGIVFIGVMDGLDLFRKYTTKVAAKIIGNGRFYEGYYRLEELVCYADSITEESESVVCWRNGTATATIVLLDSMLVSRYLLITDTLLTEVERLNTVRKTTTQRIDSLLVSVRADGQTVRISFPVSPPVAVVVGHNLEEQEKQYRYE